MARSERGAQWGAGVRLCARSELRRRWRALVSLGVIAGLAAGLTLAAVAGARRTSTAYERNRAATAAPDALVFATQVGIEDQDYSAVLDLPEVVDGGTFNLAPVGIKEHPMGALAPGDDHLYRTLSRPLLVDGRLPDPEREDEIVVNREAASRYGLHVGQHLTVVGSTDITDFFRDVTPSGPPEVRATVVGIGDSTIDAVFLPDQPGFVPSAAFLARFPEVPRFPNLVVRLRPGTDVTAFHRRASAALGLPDVPVRDLAEDRKRVSHGTDLERTGLLLFAGAALLAGLVLVGQALTRTVYAMAEPVLSLRALGLTNSELVGALVLPLALTAVVAGGVAVAGAVLFSERFPVGLARRLEPDLGVHADWWVLAPGAALVTLVILAGAAYAAFRSTRRLRSDEPVATRSSVAGWARRAAPVPVAIGMGLALEGGRGRRSLPVRPALAGAVIGVVGVIGALGLVKGIDDALASPSRSGQVWDAYVAPTEEHNGDSLGTALTEEAGVGAVAAFDRAPLDVDGDGLPVYAIDAVKGHLSFVVLEGRAPARDDEAAIGPASAKALGKSIGDTVTVSSTKGTEHLRIVGSALLAQTPHTEFDQGLWTTPGGLAEVDDRPPEGIDVEFVVKAKPGVGHDDLVQHLQSVYGDVGEATYPQDVLLLRNVRTLPRALALFLVLLAVAAVTHALLTAVRRRRHDLAVLRAMGFRPRQNALCILSQSMTIAAVGLVVGLPLGAVAGRLAWRWVADATPLVYVAPLALVAVGLAAPGALATANLLAAVPARRAARLRPAEVLRSE
ncbi:MAG TPA: FtsX-like permease family protein [Acidimicrobiales bacterium]|nr:FtsX-like permease family protein [Acidimicrobiales bacterium]